MTKQELLAFDPEPVLQGEWERFLCPTDACSDKPMDRLHKSFSVKGAFYHCFRCNERGFFTDIAREQREVFKKQPPKWWNNLQ